MKSRLEHEWWFSLPVLLITGIAMWFLYQSATMPAPRKLASVVIWTLCFCALREVISLLGWMLVLAFTPADKVRERTR